jgi:LssY C-terminus
MKQAAKQTGIISLTIVGIGAIIVFPMVALAYILSTRTKLRHASRPGRAVSSTVKPDDNPLTTFNREGGKGDPINMQFLGTDAQIAAAFALAGWYRADEIDFVTSTRICADSVFDRKYSTAPVSNLYLFGRKEDLAFERPGTSTRQRDHIRLWKTDRSGSDNRPIWIGSATKDTKVELSRTNHLPTHQIGPDVDAERELVVSELTETGFVVEATTRPGFGKETHGTNGGGDPYFTDGQVAVLTLVDAWAPPLATQVRNPLVARLIKQLRGIARNVLNEQKREQPVPQQGQQIGA